MTRPRLARTTSPSASTRYRSLGPATVAGGLIWAILQPYRMTSLHPRGQGLWWLVFEPPLFVVLIGALFTLFVAGRCSPISSRRCSRALR